MKSKMHSAMIDLDMKGIKITKDTKRVIKMIRQMAALKQKKT